MPVIDDVWNEKRIAETENRLLQGVIGCRTTEAVEAAITYAAFLSGVGLTAENYPLFLRMLEIENHWVVDALIGNRDPFLLLSPVQPNRFIVERIFAMMTRWHKGGIYSKNLSVILGVLQSVYSSARDGYRIYPLSIANVNALGKHLDKEKGQDDPLNRAILEVLERISRLEEQGNPEMEEVAVHAAGVRNAFFDDRKRMEDVIPPVLLVTVGDRTEVPPRKRAMVNPDSTKQSTVTAAAAKAAASAVAGGPKSEPPRPSAPAAATVGASGDQKKP